MKNLIKVFFGCLLLYILLFAGLRAQTVHNVVLKWNASPTTGVAYNVYRSTSATGTYTKINTTDVTALTYTDSTGTGGTSYFYQITSVCDATTTCPSGITGESAPTAPGGPFLFLGSPAAPVGAPTGVSN